MVPHTSTPSWVHIIQSRQPSFIEKARGSPVHFEVVLLFRLYHRMQGRVGPPPEPELVVPRYGLPSLQRHGQCVGRASRLDSHCLALSCHINHRRMVSPCLSSMNITPPHEITLTVFLNTSLPTHYMPPPRAAQGTSRRRCRRSWWQAWRWCSTLTCEQASEC